MGKAPHPGSKPSPKTPEKSSSLPWFRLYIEFAGDPNIQSLSFEDQRHFVVLMCLKGSGVLDRTYPSPERRSAVIARGLGLGLAESGEAQRRLEAAGLLVGEWGPKGWDDRQFESDHARARQAKYKAKLKLIRDRDDEVTSR